MSTTENEQDACPGCGGCGTCLRRDDYWNHHGLPNGWWDDVETYWIGLFVLILVVLPALAWVLT